MRVFERTPAGQQNRNLFLRTDVVVYVEGGKGDEEQESFDILFWSSVFRTLLPQVRVRFLPKGKKDTVLRIVSELFEQETFGVCAAVDTDYDRINGKLSDDPRILYTHGYSFENDAMGAEVLQETFFAFSPQCPESVDISAEIERECRAFLNAAKLLAIADYLAVKVGLSAIDRKKLGKYFNSVDMRNNFEFDKSSAHKDVSKAAKANRDIVKTEQGFEFDYKRYIVGHLHSEFGFRLICCLHKKHSKTSKLTKDAFYSVCIQGFRQRLHVHAADPITQFHRAQVEQIPLRAQ